MYILCFNYDFKNIYTQYSIDATILCYFFRSCSGCSKYRFIYLELSVRLVVVWVFTIQIYLSLHFLLCLHWSGCSHNRFIYLGAFCYAYNALGVHNTNLFILTLSVMLTLVWVLTMQIYFSWDFLLWLRWSGCSQYIFCYHGTFC